MSNSDRHTESGSEITAGASTAAAKTGPGSFVLWLVLAVVLIAVDQASKYYFVANFAEFERRNVLPFFDLVLVYNEGAAFSFLAAGAGWQKWLFLGLAVVASIAILVFLYQNRHQRRPWFCLSLTLILAGAIGNAIDRVTHGRVVDFLYFHYDTFHYPAFNIADSFITVGAVILIVTELFGRKKSRKTS